MLYAILVLTLALPGARVAILTLVDRYQKRPPKKQMRLRLSLTDVGGLASLAI
jgi:hypothetical protein